VVSAAQTFYDDTSFSTTFPRTTAPTAGNVTMTRKAVTYASGAFTWQTTARDTYDSYGRVEDTYDGNGNKTTTAYTVDAAGLTTAESVTNPLGQATSQTLDPTRNLTLTATDANGVVTTSQYDALGRVTSVWLDSRATTAEANDTYAYTVYNNALSGVVAKKMGDAGGYATTVTILDALGRTRQVQTDTPQGGRLITDQFYDSRGWVWKKNNSYWDSSAAPALTLVAVTDSQVPSQDEYTFDGLGRTVADISRKYANTVSTTTTVYNGDRTTVIPPKGGVIKATVTDPLGRTSETDQYTAAPTVVTPSSTFTGIWYVTGGTATATKYGYDGHGNQATITDAAGHTWTSAYDLLGRVTGKTDPDTGTSSMAYDGDGNLTQETDARGKTVSYTYDALSRKTAEYAGPTASQSSSSQTASWVYDDSNAAVSGMKYPVGHVTTETTYSGGSAYVLQAKGFNVFGESLGETVTIPSAEGTLANSYTFSHAYTAGTGLPYSDTYPAAGGLPAETTIHSYLGTPLDLPAGLGGSIDGYAQNTSYDAYGHVLQETIGTGSNLGYITSTYDPHTGLPTDQPVTRHVSTPANVDEEAYNYDLSGNITQQVSTRLGSSSPSETQCFGYDGLDRLTAAWTATDGCAATPTSSSHSTVGDPLGTASEYWTTWAYDALGDRKGETGHSVTGGTDTTTAYTYNGNSTGQPHTLTSASTTGGSSSSSTFGYDPAGNMTARTTPASGTQALAWNGAGQLASVTGSAGTTSYLYTPDGDLLVRKDPAAATLYLPGEELTLTPAGAESGIRYIPLPSGGQVVRTGGTTSYDFEIPDLHGTSTLYLDNTAQTPTWRQFTPFGAPRGTPVTWIDPHGFLNKPADPATGLTDVGAREYDPVTGQFISPDPVLDPASPQDLDPYAYGLDNPVTNSDPTGLCDQSWCPPPPARGSNPHPSQWGPGTDRSDGSDPGPIYPHGNGGGATGGSDAGSSPVAQLLTGAPHRAQILDYYNKRLVEYASSYGPDGVPAYLQLQTLGQVCLENSGLCSSGLFAEIGVMQGRAYESYQAASYAARARYARGTRGLLEFLPVFYGAMLAAAAAPELAGLGGGEATVTEEGSSAVGDAAESCLNSFPAATAVLLASGKKLAIGKIKPGVKVEATDPYTGQTAARRVARVIVHSGLHAMVALTLAGGSTLAATAHHPFYDATSRTFTTASRLHVGERLLEPSGRQIPITGIRNYQEALTAYNLEITGIHTYYIFARTTAVLVHNSCDPEEPAPWLKSRTPPEPPDPSTWQTGTGQPAPPVPPYSDAPVPVPRTPMQKVIFFLGSIAHIIHNYGSGS
jgi:RHS repeat-associated protein